MTRTTRKALHGDLSLVAAEILVQMLSAARVTGRLTFRRAARRFRLYMRDGRVTFAHAVHGPRPGAPPARPTSPLRDRVCDVLAAVLTWRDGSFSFERDALVQDGVETLDADPQELLLACLSRVRPEGGGDEDTRV